MTKPAKVLLLGLMFLMAIQTKAQDIQKWKLDDLRTAITKADKPTIFNFWATFCKPCIEEIPYIQQLVKKYEAKGVTLVLVSLDLPEAYPKIKGFAEKRKFTAPIVFLDESNADEFCPVVDESWSGAIPASLFINSKTGYRSFFEEQLTKEKVETEIKAMMGL